MAEVQGCVIMNPNKMSVVYPSCGVTWPAGGMSTNKILFPVMATILNQPKPITYNFAKLRLPGLSQKSIILIKNVSSSKLIV